MVVFILVEIDKLILILPFRNAVQRMYRVETIQHSEDKGSNN